MKKEVISVDSGSLEYVTEMGRSLARYIGQTPEGRLSLTKMQIRLDMAIMRLTVMGQRNTRRPKPTNNP